jgi:hypothetical protein
VREKLVSTLKGSSVTTAEGTESGGTGGSGLADSLRTLGRDIGITVAGGSNSRLSAEDEIRSLEDRVRELEQVVVSGKTGAEPDIPELTETSEDSTSGEPVRSEAPLSENNQEHSSQSADVSTASDVPDETVSAPTTAESFSYAYGVDQHEDFLAASPYAVSETNDERAVEASGSMDAVEAIPQGEAAPPEGDVTPPTGNPGSTGRSSRKKQRDFDPEATDDNSPSSPEA